ncbi:MAG: hypothetical protein ABS894_00835 [Aerococcus urinaeequi]
MIKWIPGVPPVPELKEGEKILVVVKWYDNDGLRQSEEDTPFVAEYAEGALHDTYDREPFDERVVVKWARLEGEPEPEKNYYFVSYMYGSSQKTHENGLIEEHPLHWQATCEKNYPGQYVLKGWKEITKKEYETYGIENDC